MARAAAVVLAFLAMAGCMATPEPSPQPLREPLFANGTLASFQATDVADLAGGAEPGIQVAPDGSLWAIAWTRMFTNAGGAWREVPTPFDHGGDSELAIAQDGSLHVLGMRLGKQGAPYLPHWRSMDGGASWEMVQDLHPEGPIDRPWMAFGPDGRLVVIWNDFAEKRATVRSSHDEGASWDDPFHVDVAWFQLVSRPVFRGEETFLTMHNGGPVIIAHQAAPGGPWRAWEGPPARVHAFFAPLAVDGEGTLHLVSVEDVDGARQVRHRSSRDGVAWSTPSTVSTGLQAVMPWPVPLRSGVGVAFYQATPAPDERLLPLQLAMPQDAMLQWHAVVAVPAAGAWRLVNTTTGPVHTGPMCTRDSDCSQAAAPFFDAFEAVALPDGGVAVVHVVHADQRGGMHGLVVARS